MMKRQLFERANFAGYGSMQGGKLSLNAVDKDFQLVVERLTVNEDKKSFTGAVEIPLQRQELLDISKALLTPYLEAFNRIKFKVKEITSDTTFSNITYITRGLYAIRLIGKYVFDSNGRRDRKALLRFYKLENWNEVKEFRTNPDAYESHLVASYDFETLPISAGAFVYKDTITIDEMMTVMEDVYFKRNNSYVQFLDSVMKAEESGKTETNSGNNGHGERYKPKTVPTEDSSDFEDEFPF